VRSIRRCKRETRTTRLPHAVRVKCNCRDRVRDEKKSNVPSFTVDDARPVQHGAFDLARHTAGKHSFCSTKLGSSLSIATTLGCTRPGERTRSSDSALPRREFQVDCPPATTRSDEDSHSQCNAINFELHQLNHVLREKCDAEAERGLRKLEALEKAIADLEHENACRCSNTICCSEATPNGTNATLRCFKSTEPRPKGESRSIRPSRRLWLPCDAAIQSYGVPRRMIYRSRRTWRNT